MQGEYLSTNSIGAYSSSDYRYGNMRKYHGLLVAANLDLSRVNVVNRIDEFIEIDGEQVGFSTNTYKDEVLYPKGFENLESFEFYPYPKWNYEVSGVIIEKSLALKRGVNRVTLRYKVTNNTEKKVSLNLVPLITFRDVDTVRSYTKKDYFKINELSEQIFVELDDKKALIIKSSGMEYKKNKDVYFDFLYKIEVERGYPATEDLQKIGTFTANVEKGEHTFEIEFNYHEHENNILNWEKSDDFKHAQEYEENLQSFFLDLHNVPKSEFVEKLVRNSDQFIVNTIDNVSLIAGYHWFGEWGRDTFMAFNGLLLKTGRFIQAKSNLLKWNKLFKNGLLPNRPYFHDYHSIDSVLWYSVALWEYFQITTDHETIEEILPNLEKAIISFQDGENNMRIDDKGYFIDGNKDKALTWMDAKVDEVPVIDRSGRAVEIQALWYNFLRITQALKEKTKDHTYLADIKAIAVSLENNFEKDFWNGKKKCLYDVIADKKDDSLRPNQLFVLYLPFKLIKARRAKQILHTLEQRLLTDVGMKTLNKEASKYYGHYQGEQKLRDNAYHNGTIWPFFLGMYLTVYLETYGKTLKSKNYVKSKLDIFEQKLETDGLEYIPEIYEADTLRPDGCISQAWSVAFLLEAITSLYK